MLLDRRSLPYDAEGHLRLSMAEIFRDWTAEGNILPILECDSRHVAESFLRMRKACKAFVIPSFSFRVPPIRENSYNRAVIADSAAQMRSSTFDQSVSSKAQL